MNTLIAAFACIGLALAPGCAAEEKNAQPPAHPATEEQPSPPNPNVILIAVDTLRADHLGAYGYERPTSPNIDAFAALATVFERAYAAAPWTVPSMASVMTGQPPAVLGLSATAVEVAPRFKRLAEFMRQAGYKTAGVVSQRFLTRQYGFARGFDWWNETAAYQNEMPSSPRVTREAIAAIERMKEQPFFLFAHYYDVHGTFVEHAGHEFVHELAESYDGPVKSGQSMFEFRDLVRAGVETPADWARLGDLYDSEIQSADKHIGGLFEHLKTQGLYDDALVVLISDHGIELGEGADHWLGYTSTLSEEALKVPFILKAPRQSEGTRLSSPVSLVDLTPTVLKFAQIDAPRELFPFGAPLAMTDDDPCRRPVFAETLRWGELQAVFCGDWKLVFDTGIGTYELYQLETDPRAHLNIAERSEGMLMRLEEMRREWEQQVYGQQPHVPAHPGAPELTEEELRQLQMLGYIEPS